MSFDDITSAIAMAVVVGVLILPLVLNKRARFSYRSAIVTTSCTYLVLVPMLYLGAGMVGPVGFDVMWPGLLMYAVLMALICVSWCFFVVRRHHANG